MKQIIILVAILFSFNLSGCGSDANAESPLPESEIEQLHIGDYTANGSRTMKKSEVITSSEYYQNELLRYSTEQAVEVDFTNNQILLVDMGARDTGGYSVSIDSSKIYVDDNTVTIEIFLTVPGSNCIVTTGITTPYAFYRIPTQKEILVRENLVLTDCD